MLKSYIFQLTGECDKPNKPCKCVQYHGNIPLSSINCTVTCSNRQGGGRNDGKAFCHCGKGYRWNSRRKACSGNKHFYYFSICKDSSQPEN